MARTVRQNWRGNLTPVRTAPLVRAVEDGWQPKSPTDTDPRDGKQAQIAPSESPTQEFEKLIADLDRIEVVDPKDTVPVIDQNGRGRAARVGALLAANRDALVSLKESVVATKRQNFANQEEAEAGVSLTAVMTPLRTVQQINARLASEDEAETGSDNVKLITPLRGKQQIIALVGLVTPEMFGAAGDGVTDDTAEILAAATAAVAANMPLHFRGGAEYLFSYLPLPDNLRAIGNGATLIADGSVGGSSTPIVQGANSIFDGFTVEATILATATDNFVGDGATTAFVLSAATSITYLDVSVAGTRMPVENRAGQMTGTDNYTHAGSTLTFTAAPANGAAIVVEHLDGAERVVRTGAGSKVRNLVIRASRPYGNRGEVTYGALHVYDSDCEVENVRVIDYGNAFQVGIAGAAAAPPITNIWLRNLTAEGCIRGGSIRNVSDITLDGFREDGTHYAARRTSGNTGLLIGSVQNADLTRMIFVDSPEHGFRLGGELNGEQQSRNIRISNSVATRPGASGFKINPNAGERAQHIYMDNCHVIDGGLSGPGAGNHDAFMIEKCDYGVFNGLTCRADAYTYSQGYGISVKFSNNIEINNPVIQDTYAEGILITYNADAEDGVCSNVHIKNPVVINCGHGTNILGGGDGPYPAVRIGFTALYQPTDITIEDFFIQNPGNGKGITFATTGRSGLFLFTGECTDTGQPWDGPIANDLDIILNITRNGVRFMGHPTVSMWQTNTFEIAAAGDFDAADTATQHGAVMLRGGTQAAGAGVVGAALAFSSSNSARRRLVLAQIQTGANARHSGLAVYGQNAGIDGTDILTLLGTFDHLGVWDVVGSYEVDGVQVVANRKTGWDVDTGTAKRTANATYTVGTALTAGATYTQSEITAIITRQAALEAAMRDATQTIKALKDDLHGTAGHGLIGT
jgi:hypothetical protein